MIVKSPVSNSPSLRTIVLAATGQDVRKCCSCGLCSEAAWTEEEADLALLVQWVIANDERALTAALTWPDRALQTAQQVCANHLDFQKMLAALRVEAERRGFQAGELQLSRLQRVGEKHGK
jgi:hypothetical protein